MPHPWRRYWARFLDSFLAVTLTGMLALLVVPDYVAADRSGYGIAFWALLFWALLEAVLISRFATTPGKALFRIRVTRPGGRRLGFGQAFKRSLRVWSYGTAMGLPVFAQVAALWHLRTLSRTGMTRWDRLSGSEVAHAPLGWWRWATLASVVSLFLLLGYLGNYI